MKSMRIRQTNWFMGVGIYLEEYFPGEWNATRKWNCDMINRMWMLGIMAPSAESMVSYREGGEKSPTTLRCRSKTLEGYWWYCGLAGNFNFGGFDVTHDLIPGYNLLWLKIMADRGHKYVGEKRKWRCNQKAKKRLALVPTSLLPSLRVLVTQSADNFDIDR